MSGRPSALVSTLLSLVLWLTLATVTGAVHGDSHASVRATAEQSATIGQLQSRLSPPPGDRQRRTSDGGHPPLALPRTYWPTETLGFASPCAGISRSRVHRAATLAFPYDATAPPASQG
jgi:hypothetical protein